MPPGDEYKRNAIECLRLVSELRDPESKALMLQMANAWTRLAAQAVKNSQVDLVYETPARD